MLRADRRMMPNPEVCIGVVLYRDEPAAVEKLLVSLEANAREADAPSQRVYFFDNSPTDELREVVTNRAGTIDYHHSAENLGFGRAHNALMARTFGDTSASAYVCVNPDAILHPRCIAQMAVEVRRWQRPGLVEALQFPDEHPKRYDRATHSTPWCSGCVLLVTRELFETIGGFDDRFFLYCEDVDLSWRARAAGFSTSVAPSALAFHWVGERPPDGSMVLHMQRSGVLLGAKYGNAAFADRCLGNSLALGGTPFEMPPLAAPAAPGIADFDHLFHFAEARW
jgi:GT2 family glycosyltransferase